MTLKIMYCVDYRVYWKKIRRLEQNERRIEQVAEELRLFREETTCHRLEMKRDIVRLQAGQEQILKKMDGQEARLRMTIGNLHNEKGKALEVSLRPDYVTG